MNMLPIRKKGAPKNAFTQSNAFKKAVRAYRQLALALRTQGLAEEAAYFSYQAHALYREVLRRQLVVKQDAGKQGRAIGSWFLQLGQYLFSSFLDLATGYGYKPWRSIITYLLIIIMFALAYSAFDHISFLPDALVFQPHRISWTWFLPQPVRCKCFHGPDRPRGYRRLAN